MNNTRIAAALAVIAATQSSQLLAQTGPMVLEEVTVTARKRTEAQQDVPISITAVSGSDLAKRGVVRFQDIELANPNTKIEPGASGAGLALAVSIRGNLQSDVATQLDPAVGVYLDGMILSRAYGLGLSMVDLQSVQTLKGPQGTLFGRNTTGGAILLTSRDPALGEGVSGHVEGEYGELDTWGLEGAIDIPLGDTAAVRVVAKHKESDDYVEFTDGVDLGRREEDLLRAKLLWAVGENTMLRFSAEIGEAEATNAISLAEQPNNPQLTGKSPIAGEFLGGAIVTTVVATDELSTVDSQLYVFEAIHDTSIGEFKFTTGYRELDVETDQTLPPGVGFTRQDKPDLENFTAELQYQGDFFSDRMSLTSGLYYFDEQTTEDQLTRPYEEARIILPDPLSETYMETDMESLSLYAQATYELGDATRLTLGGRYTSDDRESTGTASTVPLTYEDSNDEFNYLLGVDHRFNDAVMIYANTGSGYRSGGANLAEDSENPGQWGEFAPEDVTNYEAGMKSDWMDRRLRVNVALFYQDYEDYQYTRVELAGGVPVRSGYTVDATIQGSELEVSALLPADFTLTASWGYIDSEIDGGDNDGDALPSIPENTYSIVLGKSFQVGDGSLDFRVLYNYRDEIYNGVGRIEETTVDARELVNLSATYEQGPWTLTGYVNNATDEEYYRGILYSPSIPGLGLAGLNFTSLGVPRVAGVKLGYAF